MENENTNGLLDWEGLYKMLQLSALNQKNTDKQMGILVEGYKEVKGETVTLRSDFTKLSERMDLIESEQFVRPHQQAQYEPAIKNRVADLLRDAGYIDDKEMWQKFMRKCWSDCKTKSVMVGKRGVYTEKCNHSMVLEYIGNWTPEGYGGAIGYINHITRKQGQS